MKYFEATQEAERLRAARNTQDILAGVNYSVGLPVGSVSADDYYVIVFGPRGDNLTGVELRRGDVNVED